VPILRYFTGRYDQKYQLKEKIRYLDNSKKQIWARKKIPRELLVGSYGVDFATAYDTFIGLHTLHGFRGSRLFYHLLLDFEPGIVDPFQVREIGYEECRYLQSLNAMFAFGVHCVPHPHMHVVINSILPLTGTKLQIKKNEIFRHKIWANKVLQHYNLPLIEMWLPDDWEDEDDG